MWWIPFKTCYLQCSITRYEIEQKILQLTYLSDEDYRKSDNIKKFFYGTNSSESFSLQTIAENTGLTAFAHGNILGVQNETWIILRLKAFRHRRIYFLLLSFALVTLAFLIAQINSYKMEVLSNLAFDIALLIDLGIFIYLGIACNKFWKQAGHTISFFEVLTDGNQVSAKEIPIVFRNLS